MRTPVHLSLKSINRQNAKTALQGQNARPAEPLSLKSVRKRLCVKAFGKRKLHTLSDTHCIKTPKLYFFDTGLVAYLTRYSSPEILMNGAINSAILENYAVAEIIKTYHNDAKECILHYYRDKDAQEIDLVIESDGELHPLEIKKTVHPRPEIANAFKLLDKSSVPRGTGAVLCLREDLSAMDRNTYIVPIWTI